MSNSRRSIVRLTLVSLPLVALMVAATRGPPPLVADIGAVSFRGCSDQENCSSWQHKMIQPPLGSFLYDEHPCNEPTFHYGPPCGSFAYNANDVLGASVERLATLVDTPNSNVIWNEERGAVQVLGCNNDVMASVAVDNAMFRRVLEVN